MNKKIKITQYKWAGNWGPFSVKISCGECDITKSIIENIIEKKFQDHNVIFEVLPWLDNWYKIILKGAWHAPIIFLNDKIISQGKIVDFKKLEYHLNQELGIKNNKELEVADKIFPEPVENTIFTKKDCKYCKKAKVILKNNDIYFKERDIVENPKFADEMFFLVKKFWPKKKPITVPQIWLNGEYIGVFEDIQKLEDNGELKKYR